MPSRILLLSYHRNQPQNIKEEKEAFEKCIICFWTKYTRKYLYAHKNVVAVRIRVLSFIIYVGFPFKTVLTFEKFKASSMWPEAGWGYHLPLEVVLLFGVVKNGKGWLKTGICGIASMPVVFMHFLNDLVQFPG